MMHRRHRPADCAVHRPSRCAALAGEGRAPDFTRHGRLLCRVLSAPPRRLSGQLGRRLRATPASLLLHLLLDRLLSLPLRHPLGSLVGFDNDGRDPAPPRDFMSRFPRPFTNRVGSLARGRVKCRARTRLCPTTCGAATALAPTRRDELGKPVAEVVRVASVQVDLVATPIKRETDGCDVVADGAVKIVYHLYEDFLRHPALHFFSIRPPTASASVSQAIGHLYPIAMCTCHRAGRRRAGMCAISPRPVNKAVRAPLAHTPPAPERFPTPSADRPIDYPWTGRELIRSGRSRRTRPARQLPDQLDPRQLGACSAPARTESAVHRRAGTIHRLDWI
jgi:hypothetical protein